MCGSLDFVRGLSDCSSRERGLTDGRNGIVVLDGFRVELHIENGTMEITSGKSRLIQPLLRGISYRTMTEVYL